MITVFDFSLMRQKMTLNVKKRNGFWINILELSICIGPHRPTHYQVILTLYVIYFGYARLGYGPLLCLWGLESS